MSVSSKLLKLLMWLKAAGGAEFMRVNIYLLDDWI